MLSNHLLNGMILQASNLSECTIIFVGDCGSVPAELPKYLDVPEVQSIGRKV